MFSILDWMSSGVSYGPTVMSSIDVVNVFVLSFFLSSVSYQSNESTLKSFFGRFLYFVIYFVNFLYRNN